MSVNIPGTIGVVVFYILISAISYIIAFKRHLLRDLLNYLRRVKNERQDSSKKSTSEEIVIEKTSSTERENGTNENEAVLAGDKDFALAGRTVGLAIGTFTLTAGWVGGGFINGTAEKVYISGLLYTTAPFGYSLSLLVGGLLFGKKLRQKNYMTMIDPLQNSYGEKFGAVLLFFALFAEIFWSLAILTALGTSVSVILEIDPRIAVGIGASVAVVACILGGMKFLIYIDTIQLTLVLLVLWGSVPFFLTHDNVSNISIEFYKWSGFENFVPFNMLFLFEEYALLIFGGIPWQTYFQKILSCKSDKIAYQMSISSCFLCLIVTIPPIIIGAVAKCTDWSKFNISENHRQPNSVLPDAEFLLAVIMTRLLPAGMVFIALGSITAAALSSTQSSILGAATMISNNFFKTFFRPNASDKTLTWCSRISMIIIGGFAVGFSFLTISVYKLWFFCSDLVFIILFPRLVCSVYVSFANIYGGIVALVIPLILRLMLGEELLRIPQVLILPPIVNGVSYFPGKTFCMVLSIALDLAISKLFYYFFIIKKVDRKFDFLGMMSAEDYKDINFSGNIINEEKIFPLQNLDVNVETQLQDGNIHTQCNFISEETKCDVTETCS